MPATTMRQIRFYDFNVYSSASGGEKLRYIHRDPAKRRISGEFRAVGVGQFPVVCIRGEGTGAGGCSGVDGEHQDEETRRIWGDVGCIVTPLNRKVRD